MNHESWLGLCSLQMTSWPLLTQGLKISGSTWNCPFIIVDKNPHDLEPEIQVFGYFTSIEPLLNLHNIHKSMTAMCTTALRLDCISQNHNRDDHYQKRYHDRIHHETLWRKNVTYFQLFSITQVDNCLSLKSIRVFYDHRSGFSFPCSIFTTNNKI